MAKNTFNFQAKMGLDVKNFKKGVGQVNTQLAKLKSSFMSLAGGIGVGLGFEKLISSVKDTAVKLNTAMATLKNASTTVKTFKTETGTADVAISNFNQNLQFTKNLSNEYGQDLVSLIDNFAKFVAASKNSTLSMEQQKYIFEQLTRAAASFHLSADRTSDMMNAVVQMMSKGKVASEELRRQLGNTLPGAFNIMAAAMGVTTGKLEDMMKNSEVLAQDALPKFAMQLERITRGSDFTSLQTSLNRFKNAWYELVSVSGADSMFQNLTDKGTSALKHLAVNFKTYTGAMVGALVSLLAGSAVVKAFAKGMEYFRNYRMNAEAQIAAIEKRMKALHATLAQSGKFPAMSGMFTSVEAQGSPSGNITLMKEYNDLLLQREKINNSLGQTTISTNTITQKGIKEANNGIKKVLKQTVKAERQIILTGNGWTKFGKLAKIAGNGILGIFKNIGKFIYGALGPIGLIVAGITVAGTAIGAIVGHFKKIREEEERIVNITNGLDGRISEKMAPTQEDIKKVTRYKEIFDELGQKGDTGGQKLYFEKIKEIVPALSDITYEDLVKKADGFDKLTDAINNWKQSLAEGTDLMALFDDLDFQHGERVRLIGEINKIRNSGKPLTKQQSGSRAGGDLGESYTVDTKEGKVLKAKERELSQVEEAIRIINSKLNKIKVTPLENPFKTGGNDEKSPIQKIYEDNLAAVSKLKNQKKEVSAALKDVNDEVKKTTSEGFDEDMHKLYQRAYEEAAGTGALVLSDIQKKVANGKNLTKLEKWYLDLAQRAAEAAAYFAEKTATEAAQKGVKQWAKGIKKEQEKLKKDVATGEYTPKEVKPRDKRFDYKKTGLDISREEFDIVSEKTDKLRDKLEKLKEDYRDAFGVEPPEDIQQFLDTLKQKYQDVINVEGGAEIAALIKNMERDLLALSAASNSWAETMAIEEMIQDLKDFDKELKSLYQDVASASWDAFAGTFSSIDSIVSSFERLKDVAEDVDATGWDKFMATFQVFESVVNTVMSAMQTLNAIMEISNAIKDIQLAKQLALNQATMQGTVLTTAGAAATTAAAGAATANAAATGAEAAAAATNTAAKSGEAIANATASGAKMPFPLNLLAIAAGVAAVIAALAAVSKFETGGIVGGNSTRGDKNLVRVNSGEMILNKAQQGTLWSMLNGKGGMGGNVNFKIRGADLVGTIENYNSKRRG